MRTEFPVCKMERVQVICYLTMLTHSTLLDCALKTMKVAKMKMGEGLPVRQISKTGAWAQGERPQLGAGEMRQVASQV